MLRERSAPQGRSWEDLSREELRLQANMRPLSYVEWQCEVHRAAYLAACERNRQRDEAVDVGAGTGREDAQERHEDTREGEKERITRGKGGTKALLLTILRMRNMRGW